MALVLTLKLNNKIKIDNTIISIAQIKGKQIRLKFEGPSDVKINRLDEQGNPVRFTQRPECECGNFEPGYSDRVCKNCRGKK